MNHVIYCPDVWLWSLIYSLYRVPSRLPVCAWTLTKTVWLVLEDNAMMKISRVCIITTMLNVLIFFLFFLVRERFMIKYLRAHVCACLFEYPPQSGKWIGKKKKKLTGCVRSEWMCVWKQLNARLSGNDCDSLKVQKQWHYCICLLSCLFFRHVLSLYLYYLLSNAIREYFCF